MYHPFPHTPNILIILYAPITPLFRIILFSPLCFFACTFSFYKPYKSINLFAPFYCITPYKLFNSLALFHFFHCLFVMHVIAVFIFTLYDLLAYLHALFCTFFRLHFSPIPIPYFRKNCLPNIIKFLLLL